MKQIGRTTLKQWWEYYRGLVFVCLGILFLIAAVIFMCKPNKEEISKREELYKSICMKLYPSLTLEECKFVIKAGKAEDKRSTVFIPMVIPMGGRR